MRINTEHRIVATSVIKWPTARQMMNADYVLFEKLAIRKRKKVIEVHAFKDRHVCEHKFRQALQLMYPAIDKSSWEVTRHAVSNKQRAYISKEDLVVWRLAYENRV